MTSDVHPSAIVVMGPTAVGKSELVVELAARAGGEIVNSDAFQVYGGLDILGAKPSSAVRARIRHHLIGEVPLSSKFDVGQWRRRAVQSIAEIAARGRVPIVCGGTGLYIRALTHGLAELPPADSELRALLETEALPQLVERLRSLDPDSSVDMNNPRRVVRALEVCILTGHPFSSFRTQWERGTKLRGVVLMRSREQLHERIDARTLAMFEAGVLSEVATAGEIGPTASQMLGLREIRDLLAGKIAEAECIEAIRRATRNYAHRQMTWFRKERGYSMVDLTSCGDSDLAIEHVMAAIRPPE